MNQFIAHPKTTAALDAIVEAPRACYMLVGPRYSGKMSAALYVAEKLRSDQFDRLHVSPNDKGTITIEMAHDLVSSLSKKANRKDAVRVVIIEGAERMTVPAQNALLKVIEEPPAKTIFILLLSNVDGVLPTIKSRCQVIYVRPVAGLPDLARGRAGRDSAQALLSASPLERMLLVDKLATDKNQDEIMDCLAFLISKAVRNKNASSQALQSMQNYFIYASANVASKHALTELMIRL